MTPTATSAPIRGKMTHRCTVERDGAGADVEGNPQAPSWSTHIAAQPCWLWVRGMREIVEDDRTIVVEDLRMLAPKGTDITEQDRIIDVVDRRALSVHAGPFDVQGVIRHLTHIELVLEVVRG